MGGNEGPRVEINATCFPCRYVNSDELYCLRPQAAEKSGSPVDDRGKYIGTLNWRTPMWCPLLLETTTSLLKSPYLRWNEQTGFRSTKFSPMPQAASQRRFQGEEDNVAYKIRPPRARRASMKISAESEDATARQLFAPLVRRAVS